MKPTLQPGITHTHTFRVTAAKTVPALYPEAASFQAMPAVFATGYLTGLLEWACVELLAPYLDVGEGSLGTMVNFTHDAPTPPGLTVTVEARWDRFVPRVAAKLEQAKAAGLVTE